MLTTRVPPPLLFRAIIIWLPRRFQSRLKQGPWRPTLDCWPRSRREIPKDLVRIDQGITLNSIARVAATKEKDWKQDRETTQVVRRSGQGVQDKTEQDRSDLPNRSARFISAKQNIYLAHAAHFRPDQPILRRDRTDPKGGSTQENFLLSEDFRTAKTPTSRINRDRCDPWQRSRRLQIVIGATQDQDRRTLFVVWKFPTKSLLSTSKASQDRHISRSLRRAQARPTNGYTRWAQGYTTRHGSEYTLRESASIGKWKINLHTSDFVRSNLPQMRLVY